MKKTFLLLLFFAVSSVAMQTPDPIVFSSSSLVWCGLDFSQVKCVGREGFNDPYQIKNRFFKSWNELVLVESKKYNVQEFYQKSRLINNLSVVTERNEIPEVDELVVDQAHFLEEGQLQNIIREYNFNDVTEGLGLVYVVESLNKSLQQASVYVVFFDLSSKEILWKQKYIGAPTGFGFRNYWAGAFYKVMKASEKDYSKALKRAARRN